MFYTYRQNNSGGSFCGPAMYVIIEATSENEANRLAEDLGLYFDGAGDCECCGNRWSYPDSPTEYPSIYDKKVTEKDVDSISGCYGLYKYDKIPYCVVKYADGRIKQYTEDGAESDYSN